MITLIQATIFISYVTFLMVRFKKPLGSISYSWYALPKPINNLFTLFCWSIGMLMIMQGHNVWFFLSGSGLGFVGAATMYLSKSAHTNVVHYVGAGVGIGCALFGLSLEYGIHLPIIIFVLGSIPIIAIPKVNNKIWWVEILAFLVIILGFILKSSF